MVFALEYRELAGEAAVDYGWSHLAGEGFDVGAFPVPGSGRNSGRLENV